MANKKFSDFLNGNEVQIGDQVVGLRDGLNYRFNFPGLGIQDGNGNYMLQYASVGAAAVNYPKTLNSNTGSAVVYTAGGTDSNISVSIQPVGTSPLILDGFLWPTSDGTNGQFMYTNGAHQLGFTSASYPIAPGAAGTVLYSTGSNWVPSTFTIANTFSINTILYASGANTVTGLATTNSAVMTTSSVGVPGWSASMTNGQLLIGSTGNAPALATLTAGAGVTISNSAGGVTITADGGGFSWTTVSGTSQSMVAANGYFANNAGLVTLTLPASAALGDTVRVQGQGAGLFKIAQNAGQTIYGAGSSTTAGVGGSLTALAQYNSIEIACMTPSSAWVILSLQGGYTIV